MCYCVRESTRISEKWQRASIGVQLEGVFFGSIIIELVAALIFGFVLCSLCHRFSFAFKLNPKHCLLLTVLSRFFVRWKKCTIFSLAVSFTSLIYWQFSWFDDENLLAKKAYFCHFAQDCHRTSSIFRSLLCWIIILFHCTERTAYVVHGYGWLCKRGNIIANSRHEDQQEHSIENRSRKKRNEMK